MFNAEGTDYKLPTKPKIRLKPALPDRRQIAVLPLRAIQDKELNHAAVRVLALVCSYANRAGITWVGQARLASDIGVSFRAISRQINILKKKKYIEILVKGGKLSHTATMRVIFNPTIGVDDAIALQTDDMRSPAMAILEEMEMDKKVAVKRTKRGSKAVKESSQYLPSQEVKERLSDAIVEHNNVEGIVQEVYRSVFLKEKLINDLDLKGFEMIAIAEMLESELKECLELWLRARTGEPDTILEFSKSLLAVETR